MYKENFLQYGFTFITENNEHCPLCLICYQVLAGESLKPAKLKRHFHTKHNSLCNRPVEFFHRLLRTSEKQGQLFESEFVNEGRYTRASFKVSSLIAKSKKPYHIGEELILPAAIKLSEIVHGKKKRPMKCDKFHCQTILWRGGFPKSAKINSSNSLHKLKKAVNLPSSLMSRRTLRIRLIFCHMFDTFTITTFTRIDYFVNLCMDVQQGWIFSRKLMSSFRKCFWTDCAGVCTDGAAAMTGHTAGFNARVRSASDTPITFTHFMIHRETQVAYKNFSEFKCCCATCF